MKNKYNPLLEAGIQKINKSNIVTVGVGGDFPTHALAFAEGKRDVIQISDVTEIVSPVITGNYKINGNGYKLQCDYQLVANGDSIIIENLEIRSYYSDSYGSEFIYANILELNKCYINTSGIRYFMGVNEAYFYNSKIQFNNRNYYYSIAYKGAFIDCVFDANISILNGFIFNNINNVSFENCKFTGNYRYTNIRGTNLSFEKCKNLSGKHIEIVCNSVEQFSFCENLNINCIGGTTPKISNCKLIVLRIGGDINISNIENSIVWFKADNNNSASVLNDVNVTSSDIVFLENRRTAITFTKKFKQINGTLYGKSLDHLGYFEEFTYFEGGATFIAVDFILEVTTIIYDNFTITQSDLKNVRIGLTADNTIFTNNRVSGTFTDTGTNTELNNNIIG